MSTAPLHVTFSTKPSCLVRQLISSSNSCCPPINVVLQLMSSSNPFSFVHFHNTIIANIVMNVDVFHYCNHNLTFYYISFTCPILKYPPFYPNNTVSTVNLNKSQYLLSISILFRRMRFLFNVMIKNNSFPNNIMSVCLLTLWILFLFRSIVAIFPSSLQSWLYCQFHGILIDISVRSNYFSTFLCVIIIKPGLGHFI